MQGRAIPPRNSWVCPLFTSLRVPHNMLSPCQENKSVTGAVARPRRHFFFARKGGSSFSVDPYWELMSPNHNVKEEYQSQYQMCFRGHPSGPGIAESFTEFQARCKIVLMFQERISFPGSWQVRPGRSRSVPDGTSSHGPKPPCTFELPLARREPVLPARMQPTSRAFSLMVLIWKPTSEIFWGLGSTPFVQSASPKPSKHMHEQGDESVRELLIHELQA